MNLSHFEESAICQEYSVSLLNFVACMKKILLILFSLFSLKAYSFEYKSQFENEQIRIMKAEIGPNEKIGPRRDAYPQIVIALKGGVLTRLEADGQEIEIELPTGVAVPRKPDPTNELHTLVNNSSDPMDLIVIQVKDKAPLWEKRENSQNIDLHVKLSCPPCDELEELLASIQKKPTQDASTLAEWTADFMESMEPFMKLIERGHVTRSWWSLRTDTKPNQK